MKYIYIYSALTRGDMTRTICEYVSRQKSDEYEALEQLLAGQTYEQTAFPSP